jgi:photosystem II stability/assembly factor-like uncharacterized protein
MGGYLSNSKNAIWAVCPTGHAAGLQISTDRGATWTPYTLSQPLPDPGTGIAAIDGQHAVVIDTATGLLLRLTTTKPSVSARIPATDVVASFVGFTDPIHGFALVGIQNAASSQAATELWRTTDGGTTWVVVKISP